MIEDGTVVITVIVYVHDLFAAGKRDRCNQFGIDLGEMVPVKNLGELRLYEECVYDRNREAGLLTISQQTYAETLVAEYGVQKRNKVPLSVDTKLHEVDGEMDLPEEYQFSALIGSFM